MKKIFTLLTLLLCAVTSSWADPTYKNDFTNGQVVKLSTTNVDAAVTAGWIVKAGTLSSSSVSVGLDPNTDAAPTSTSDYTGSLNIYKVKTGNNRYTLYVTGVSKIKFYVRLNKSRSLSAYVNGASSATEIIASSSDDRTGATGELELDPDANNSILLEATNDSYPYAIKVTVPETDTRDPLSLSFTPNNQNIGAGGTLSTAFSILTDISGEEEKYSVTYSSSKDAIATVNSSGVVTGVAVGTTTIKATVTATADATYKTTTASITVNVIPTYAWSSSYGVPSGTLNFSDATTAATVLNGTTWHADYGRPIFDNDDDKNYFTCSVVTLYSATASWVRVASGNSSGEEWSATDVFKGYSAYMTSAKAAVVSTGSNKYYAVRVKGVSKVKAYAKSNANSQKVYLAAFELTGETPAASTTNFSTCGNTASVIEVSLDDSKEYVITLTNDGNSNSRLYEMAFFYDKSVKFENVPVGATGWSTYSTDKALDFTGLEIEAYQVTGYEGTAITKSKIDGTVAANTGLLVKGTPSTNYNVPVVASGTDYSATNKMVASVSGGTVSAGVDPVVNYVLMKVGDDAVFQWIGTTSATLGANKAYLSISGGPKPAGARGLSIDDEVTAIKNIKVGTEDNVYYDLNGRRVLYPTKGLYIVNGKKIVVK